MKKITNDNDDDNLKVKKYPLKSNNIIINSDDVLNSDEDEKSEDNVKFYHPHINILDSSESLKILTSSANDYGDVLMESDKKSVGPEKYPKIQMIELKKDSPKQDNKSEQNNHNNTENKQVNNINNNTNVENNSWTPAVEKFIEELAGRCRARQWMHHKEKNKFEKTEKIMRTTEAILLAIVGILTSSVFVSSISGSNDDGCSDESGIFEAEIILISVEIVFLIVLAAIKGMRENGDYQRKIEGHKGSMDKFSEMALSIVAQLILSPQDRINGKEYSERMHERYSLVSDYSLRISDKVTVAYDKNKKDVMMPIGIMEIQTSNRSPIPSRNKLGLPIHLPNSINDGETAFENRFREVKLDFLTSPV